MGGKLDNTGVRYGKVIGVCPTNKKASSGEIIWVWLCDCGKTFEHVAGQYRRDGGSKGCPECVAKERSSLAQQRFTRHDMCLSIEYRTWVGIKNRVLNPNSKAYAKYSKLGMEEDFINSFAAFYEEIGAYPTDGSKYSVDRIDNNRGYYRGNIRWATNYQQK